jgi:hypothetical protein
MLIDQDGNQITAGDHMTGNGDILAMSTAWRIVAVLNKKVEFGPLLNVLGHLMTGLAGGIPDRTGLDLQQYFDGDGDIHPDISCHPVIVLRADRSNQLRALRARLRDVNIRVVDFVHTMTEGGTATQLARTQETPAAELEYLGIAFMGDRATLDSFTRTRGTDRRNDQGRAGTAPAAAEQCAGRARLSRGAGGSAARSAVTTTT